MIKKFTVFAIILVSIFNLAHSRGLKNNGIPFYLKYDFYEKYPNFWKYPIFGGIKHYDTPPEVLKFVPEKTKLLSNDGIETVNISGAPVWTDAQTETWMAINPANPKNIIATANDNVFLSGYQGYRMSAFVSKDGGKTWKNSPTPSNKGYWFSPQSNQATIFDPAITFDTKGNCYYAYGFAETYYGETQKYNNKNGVFVVKSTNGGDTWDGLSGDVALNNIVPITYDAFGGSNNPFHDRYTMTCDISSTSQYKDKVYITWRCFSGIDGIVISSSGDGGNTWSTYYKIADGGQAPMPACGPNGELYVTWIDVVYNEGVSKALFARSVNGGASIEYMNEAQRVTSIGTYDNSNGRQTFTDKGKMRVSSVPQIACDISNSPYRGNIYVVQAGRESANGPYAIYLSKSTNKGNNWKSKIRIDNNTLRNDLFFPSISVDPSSGMISVLYYSSQNDSKNNGVDAYVAISNDGGTTWKNIRLSSETKYLNASNATMPQGASGGVYWGDYTSIVSYNKFIYPLWWMPTMGNEFGSNDLFTAFLSPGPAPVKNLAASNIIDSKVKVKLTWTNPTTNMFGETLANLKININRNGVKIGEVSNATEYIDETVTDGINYTYSLIPQTDDFIGAEASISIIAGGNPKTNPPTDLSWKPSPKGFLLTWKNPSKTIENIDIKDKIKLKVYDLKSNTVIATLSGDNIQAGNFSTMEVETTTKDFKRINVRVLTERGTLSTESDYSNEELIVYAGEPISSLSENFDDASNKLPKYIVGNWANVTTKSASAPNCFHDSPSGNYSKNDFSYFMLPPVVINNNNSTLSLDHIALIDTTIITISGNPTYDYGEIGYSRDFGKTWWALKWVNSKTSPNFKLGNITESQFDNLALSLKKVIGDTIIIRFALASNNLKENDGWFIDNITLDNRPTDIEESPIINRVTFSIYPNPVTTDFTMSLGLPETAAAMTEVYDSFGNKLFETSTEVLAPGAYNYNFDLSNFANGVYYCRLSVNGKSITKPVIVNK